MTPTVSLMAAFHLLSPDDQNDIQHASLDHVMSLVPASPSCDANGLIKTSLHLFNQDKMRCSMTFWSCDAFGSGTGIM